MRIGSLSKSLGVRVPTLRRWTQEFAMGLSAEARGGEGRPRRFNARDQHLLTRVRDLLADEEATYVAVRRQLVQEGLMAGGEDVDGPATPEERDAGERFVLSVAERSLAPLRERLALLEEQLQVMTKELAKLQARVATLEQEEALERQPDTNKRRWIR